MGRSVLCGRYGGNGCFGCNSTKGRAKSYSAYFLRYCLYDSEGFLLDLCT
jgi:hypothetical protein